MIARLDALFHMLSWKQRPQREQTRYLTLPEFKSRPVLPTPHAVQHDNSEPHVPDDLIPRPAIADSNSTTKCESASKAAPQIGPRKPGRVEVNDRCEVVVDNKRKGRLEVHVELANGHWDCGRIRNSDDVPMAMQEKGSSLPAVLEHRTSTGLVFRFVTD